MAQVVRKININRFQVGDLAVKCIVGDDGAVKTNSSFVELGSEISNCGVEEGILFLKGKVGLVKLGTLSLAGGKEALKVSAFSSASIKLGCKIRNISIEMSDLISESSISLFK